MVELEVATTDDAAAVARVHHVARRAYYGAAGVAVDEVLPSGAEAGWARAIGRGAAITVARVDGAVAGFVCADRPQHGGPPDAVELVALHVVPDHWGSGVAVRLHGAFTDLLAGRPGVLDVWARNDRARAFYLRHGWVLDGREREGIDGSPFLGMGR